MREGVAKFHDRLAGCSNLVWRDLGKPGGSLDGARCVLKCDFELSQSVEISAIEPALLIQFQQRRPGLAVISERPSEEADKAEDRERLIEEMPTPQEFPAAQVDVPGFKRSENLTERPFPIAEAQEVPPEAVDAAMELDPS